MKFPKVVATKPPKVLSPNAVLFGRIAAVVMALFATVQLIGIVKVVDGLSQQLSGSMGWARTIAVIVLIAEILSIPFLLRHKLSEGARFVGGILAVLAPWVWLLISIWAISLDTSAPQLGVFAGANVGHWLIIVNVIWLAFNFYVVRQLGLEKTWRTLRGNVDKLKKSAK